MAGAEEDERGLCVEEAGAEEDSSRRIWEGAPRRIRRGGGRQFVEEEVGALRGGFAWALCVEESRASQEPRVAGGRRRLLSVGALRGGEPGVAGAGRRRRKEAGAFLFVVRKREPGVAGAARRRRQDESPMDDCRTKQVSIFYSF